MTENKDQLVECLNQILHDIQNKIAENQKAAVTINRSKNVRIGTMNMGECANPLDVIDSENVEVDIINSTTPKELDKIEPIIQEMIASIQHEQPKSRLIEIADKLASFGRWVKFIEKILRDFGYM
jgi:hypothetical protein